MVAYFIAGMVLGFVLGVSVIHYLEERDKKDAIVADKGIHEIAIDIASNFDDFLSEHGILVPNELREGNPEEASLYAGDWDEVVEDAEFWVRRLLWLQNVETETGFERWNELRRGNYE